MARADYETMRNVRRMRMLEREAYRTQMQRYHQLASFYECGLESIDDKRSLVREHPQIAAQVYYHFNDESLGTLLVKQYLQHPTPELREIAVMVRDVITTRQTKKKELSNILGMETIFQTAPDRACELEQDEEDLTDYLLGR